MANHGTNICCELLNNLMRLDQKCDLIKMKLADLMRQSANMDVANAEALLQLQSLCQKCEYYKVLLKEYCLGLADVAKYAHILELLESMQQ